MAVRSRPSRALVAALAATLGLGIILTLATMRLENRAAAIRFDRIADLVAGNMRQRMSQHVTLLRATRSALAAAKGGFDAERFSVYVAGLDLTRQAAGVQGIGFAPVIATRDSDTVARQLSAMHGRPVVIGPPTDQPVRVPVGLLEPHDARNVAAIGFDMLSEPVRRAALLAAIASDGPHATGPVELVQEITADKQPGFLIYLRAGTGLSGISDQGDALVYAAFRVGDLFRAVRAATPGLPLTIRCVDLEAPEQPLFDDSADPAPPALAALAVTRDIDIVGRQWRLTLTPTAPLGSVGDRSATLTVAALSLLLLGAVGMAIGNLGRSLEAAQRNAEMAERQAADRALLLREMQHRIKNHIARIQAIARQTLRSTADMGDFERVFGGRLSAMAKAQDALGPNGAASADLRSLLHDELAQVLDRGLVEAVLIGPPVRLDSREAQAIGLVAHELVTNAVKYTAEPNRSAGHGLSVLWQVTDRAGRPWLDIAWTEAGARHADARAAGVPGGFGTQLVEALIEGDLGGRFSRTFSEAGMRVSIGFPLTAGA